MTVSTTTSKTEAIVGDGSASAIPVTFPFFGSDELVVTERVIATGAETVKTLTTDYTVSGGAGSTGTVTPTAVRPSTVSWVVSRQTDRTQDIAFVDGNALPSEDLNEGLDRGVMRLQEVEERTGRSLRFPITDSEALSGELPSSIERAGQYLAFAAGTGAPIASPGTVGAVAASTFGETLVGAEDAAAGRDVLGLGTAAVTDTGTGAGDVPVLGADGLPAVSGKLLTGVAFPRGHIWGLTLANGSDAAHDVDIAAGECRNAAGTANAVLAAAITKRGDATWAVGTGNGGAFAGAALPTNGTCHWFLIVNDSTGALDGGWDTDVAGANKPAGWTVVRRLGSLRTDGSDNFRAFSQNGDEFLLSTPVLDVDATNPGTSAVLAALTVPGGIVVDALIIGQLINTTTGTIHAYFSAPATTDLTPSNSAAPLAQLSTGGENAGRTRAGQFRVRTDTSSRVRYRLSASSTNDKALVATTGWIDTRGRLA